MTRYEATFEIEEESDARAVRRLTERLYDTFREELHALEDNADDTDEPLQQFASIREAARGEPRGTLKLVYETADRSPDE